MGEGSGGEGQGTAKEAPQAEGRDAQLGSAARAREGDAALRAGAGVQGEGSEGKLSGEGKARQVRQTPEKGKTPRGDTISLPDGTNVRNIYSSKGVKVYISEVGSQQDKSKEQAKRPLQDKGRRHKARYESQITLGNIEVSPVKIPEGAHSTGHVMNWADFIINEPKDAENELVREYRNPLAAELLRQLAGWTSDVNADPKAIRAYNRVLEIFKGLYDRFQNDINLNRAFIQNMVTLEGPGAGEVKSEMAVFLFDRLQSGHLTDAGKLEFSRSLSEIIARPGGEDVLLNLATDAVNNKKLRGMFGSILQYNRIRGESIVGEALARVAHKVGRDANSAEPSAMWQGKLLGRIVANVEMAIDDVNKVEKTETSSVAHGAGIIRGALAGLDILTNGVSLLGTTPIRSGVDLLEESEKGKEGDEKQRLVQEKRKLLRSKLVQTVHSAYHTEIDPKRVLGNDDKVQEKVTNFRTWITAGRVEACDEAGYGH
jgi:hypothetical protein